MSEKKTSLNFAGTLSVWFVLIVAGLFILTALFWFASCALKSARADKRLAPEDLEYIGAFQAPPWKRGPERFGYGMTALAYNPVGKTLFANGHAHSDLVGEITIPTPSKTNRQRAVLVQPFGDVAGSFRTRLKERHLDQFGGLEVVNDKLWWCFSRYYAVQPLAAIDDATFGRSSLNLSAPQAEGMWKPGPYGSKLFLQKRTSGYITKIPQRWSDLYLPPGRRWLGVGKGHGAGSSGNSHGPPLYAIAIPDSAEDKAILETKVLIHYPPSGGPHQARLIRGDPAPRPAYFPDWSNCDQWEGVTWIAGEKSALLFAGRRGTGVTDYGTPKDVSDRQDRKSCEGGKGYHCDPYQVEILFYDPVDLAHSAQGEIESHEVLPYARMHPEFPGHHCAKAIGGMAFNPDLNELYLVQSNKENPIVHVWRIAESEPEEELPVITLRDAKLENLSDQMVVLLLEEIEPEEIVAAFELAKIKAQEWRENETFESIDEEAANTKADVEKRDTE